MVLPVLLVFLFLTLSSVGCDQSADLKANSEVVEDDPEADLQWVMESLQRALRLQSSAGGTGLRIKRTMSYEYLPPSTDQPLPTAIVTIKTNTAFLHRQTPKPKKKKSRPLGYLKDDSVEEPGPDATLAEVEKYNSSQWLVSDNDKISEKPDLSVAASVAPRQQKEIKEFGLIYRDRRWQLVEQPEGKYEQELFKYALEV